MVSEAPEPWAAAEDPATPDADAVVRRLDAVRAKRGYLLPHHGLLAVADPALLEAYDAAYTALTLTPRHLDERRKEFVWLGILIATDEAIATHHIAKFRDAGGADAEIEAAVRLAGFARSLPAFAFAGDAWGRHLPGYETQEAYRTALTALLSDRTVAPGLVEIALAAVHACLKQWRALEWHIAGAYAEGVPEVELAEAISLTMFPGSVPVFVDACAVWHRLVREDRVPASPALRAWAAIGGQGGFDEAQGADGERTG